MTIHRLRIRYAYIDSLRVTDALSGTPTVAPDVATNHIITASVAASGAALVGGVLNVLGLATLASVAVTGTSELGTVTNKRNMVTTAVDKTMSAAESGCVCTVTAADKVMTLPSTVAGLQYTFILTSAGLSVGTGLSISPAAADCIAGNGLTSVDNKDLVLAGAGDREGDMVTLVADGVEGWYIKDIIGTWSKQA